MNLRGRSHKGMLLGALWAIAFAARADGTTPAMPESEARAPASLPSAVEPDASPAAAAAANKPEAVLPVPPVPEKPEANQFPKAPAEWRAYLVQARAAERLGDPLKRCLAYPDLPGNEWPKGYAQTHCHFHFNPRMSVADISAALDRGDAEEIDRYLGAVLARHDVEGMDREDIHPFFEDFMRANEVNERLTARWLEFAPSSPYAQVARGFYLEAAGYAARGGDWAYKTPREKMQAMSKHFDKAEEHLRRAIKMQPRLLDAYIGLMSIGRADRQDVGEWAFKQARVIDPGCAEVARYRMMALEPRWGGSQEEMLAYAEQLKPLVPQRPLLSHQVMEPYVRHVDKLEEAQLYTRDTAEITDLIVRATGTERGLYRAADLAFNNRQGNKDPWRGLALVLQESRFNAINAWSRRRVAAMIRYDEPEWVMGLLRMAVEIDPDDALGHFQYAEVNQMLQRPDQARHHYARAAALDVKYKFAAFRQLAGLWLFDSALEPKHAAAKAQPFIDELHAESPNDGAVRLLRLNQHVRQKGKVSDAEIDAFLDVADLDDPWQKDSAERFRASRQKKPPTK